MRASTYIVGEPSSNHTGGVIGERSVDGERRIKAVFYKVVRANGRSDRPDHLARATSWSSATTCQEGSTPFNSIGVA
jgi:hypothetical protein